jgi:hypothetical protein
MGAPAIFEKQIEIKLLHPASTLESRIQDRNIPARITRIITAVQIDTGIPPVSPCLERAASKMVPAGLISPK